MGYEDFTTYSETDPNGHITRSSTKIDHECYGNEDAYSYKDFGSGYFSGDFEFDFKVTWVSKTGSGFQAGAFCCLTNTLDDARDFGDPSIMCKFRIRGTGSQTFDLRANGGTDEDVYEPGPDLVGNTYYCNLSRSGSTVTLKIYSDASQSTLVDTLTVTQGTDSFRYLMATVSWNNGSADITDIDFENLDLNQESSASENLSAEFVVLNSNTKDLFLKFRIGDVYRNLPAEFTVTNSETTDLFSEFIIRRSDSKDVFSDFHLIESGYRTLFSKFRIRNRENVDLQSEFTIRKTVTFDLFAAFTPARTDTKEIFAEFIVRNSDYADLLNVIATIRNRDIRDLFADFTPIRTTTKDLYADFIVRNSDYADLLNVIATVRNRDTEDLLADFISRQTATKDLSVEFIVRNSDYADLLNVIVTVRNRDTREIFSKFIVRHTATKDLQAQLITRNSDTREVFSKFETAFWETLASEFITRQTATKDLTAQFIIRRTATKTLYSKFELQTIYQVFARFWVTPEKDLFSDFTVRHTAVGEDLAAVFIVRQETTKQLYAKMDINFAEDLYARFYAVNNGSETVFSQFYVRPDESTVDELTVKIVDQVLSVSEDGSLTTRNTEKIFEVK